MRFLADVGLVALYELGESVRTRLLQLVLLAYCGGIAFAAWLFVKTLQQMEASLADSLGVPATERPGALVGRLLESGQLRDLLSGFMGEEQAASLLDRPLIALWTGAAAMILLPLVLLFAASGTVAAEVRSRSIRFLLCRTGRLEIGLGKLAGQLLLALFAALLGTAVAWIIGMTLMTGNPPVALALELLNRTGRAAIFALPIAGVGLCASQLVASPNGARFLGGVLFVGMLVAHALSRAFAGTDLVGRLVDMGRLLVSTSAWGDLWTTDPGLLAVTAARCAGLAVVYYASGHVVFSRKDL